MKRLMMLVTVVLLTAAMLVVLASTAAFARPLRGGVPLQNQTLCDKLLEEHPQFNPHPRFTLTALRPGAPPPTGTVCWHISPGLLEHAPPAQ
jgi:hypothetical protein